ncbi:MAG TPA: hypothetical protein VG456_10230 [Candidatus Sulfopaludibacter sp.]|jgi:hypothetical protein|nr:hypothetical protein [Candidatus Sulfopaludibacter sp.]
MMCREYREALMEWARGAEPAAGLAVHTAGCGECFEFLERQRALSAALRVVAVVEIPAASGVGGRVMAEFDRGARRSKVRVLGWFAAAGVAAAAALVLSVTPTRPAPVAAAPDFAQFLPIPYTIPLTPEDRASVVRMEIPVSALRAAGFQVQDADPGAMVEADVLVSQDGRARAIRPISISNSD